MENSLLFQINKKKYITIIDHSLSSNSDKLSIAEFKC